MALDPKYNRLLIVPFRMRWIVKSRIDRGMSIYGGTSVPTHFVPPDAETAEDDKWRKAGWEAKAPKSEPNAVEVAFEFLGVPLLFATEDEVKAAFKKLAFEHHPDHGGDVAKFHRAKEAKDIALSYIKSRPASAGPPA